MRTDTLEQSTSQLSSESTTPVNRKADEEKIRQESFLGRDESGLLPLEKAKSEESVRARYFKLSAIAAFVIGPVLSALWYWLVTTVVPSTKDNILTKLEWLQNYDLLFSLYLGWYVIYLARLYAVINANGARAPARVGRPCQHVYQIMEENGPLAKAPYVMMVNNSEPVGRFNRAQRAAFNLDEQLPLFVTGYLLQAAVFGKLSIVVALFFAYGAVKYCNLYKVDSHSRDAGFGLIMVAVNCNSAMVLLAVVLGICITNRSKLE